ncbi:MAG: DUF6314 family protein [Parvularculaceae bacterium]
MNISDRSTDHEDVAGAAPGEDGWIGFFNGEWKMTRVIRDYLGAREGDAKGVAIFSRAETPQTLHCRENMLVDYGGRRWPAEQELHWRFLNAWPELYFADGRFFCAMHLERNAEYWRADLVHECGEDFYKGEIEIANENFWRLVWRVKGPRKDYALETTFERQR